MEYRYYVPYRALLTADEVAAAERPACAVWVCGLPDDCTATSLHDFIVAQLRTDGDTCDTKGAADDEAARAKGPSTSGVGSALDGSRVDVDRLDCGDCGDDDIRQEGRCGGGSDPPRGAMCGGKLRVEVSESKGSAMVCRGRTRLPPHSNLRK